MPNITPTVTLDIEQELDKLELYKYHPNGLLNVSLNRLTDMLDGKIEITDPANPFTYLLETSCLNTAFAIQEYTLLTRKLYPRLANGENDLYLHMSDLDYLGRFSEPAYANTQFNILFNDFTNKATYDIEQKEYVLKLPRHLKLTVGDYIFTLPSAIVIRLTESNVIDVKFENQDFNNIFPVQTNYINFNVVKVNQEETYLNFEVRLPEVDIETLELPVEKSKLFRNTITYNPSRLFYYFRAFYYDNGKWNEMIVTHTDQVYDIYKPTCIIKVLQESNSLEYYIPPVYVNSGKIGTKVKFLIYTTYGAVNVNFNDYKLSEFSVEYNPVFQEEELDEYTEPLQLISKIVYIKDEVIAGKTNMAFTDLKNNVIENSIGDRVLPVTNKQIEFYSTQNNFRLIKDVDVVTNRVFLLECSIPNATTRYPITKFNLDIIEYKTSINHLRLNTNSVVAANSNVTIIPEKTLFALDDNGMHVLSTTEYNQLVSLSDIELTTEVNTNKYLSVFYHYILDTSNNKTELRAYDISLPEIKQINFKEFNATGRVGINTTNCNIVKSPTGFTLDILANLKKYVGTVNETNITPYIIYKDSEDSLFYLEGRLFTLIGENPVYRFEFISEYHIDSNNLLKVNNFKDNNGSTTSASIGLECKLELIYVSNIIPVTYKSTDIDTYIHDSFLAVGNAVITLEELTIKYGNYLERLYTVVHSSTGTYEYEVYTEDIPLLYTSTVYDSNNTIIHTVNEIVHNTDGEIIYKHKKGDVVLDSNNNPVPINTLDLDRYLNLLFIDYNATLSNKPLLKNYREYIRTYLTENIVGNASTIQDEMLENTESFVVIPKNISSVRIKTPTKTTSIKSMQGFKVSVYVNERVYNNADSRDSIEYTIVSELDKYLYEHTLLSKTELLNVLYGKLKEFISSISLEKFTELNEEYLEVLDSNARISLNKLLVTEADGYNLQEDITITFVLV